MSEADLAITLGVDEEFFRVDLDTSHLMWFLSEIGAVLVGFHG